MSFLQAIIDGLLVGGVYAVISIGLTLVYGVMGIVNFAQAEFLMIGMFVSWFAWAYLGLDPVLAAPLSFAVAFGIGWLVQGQLICARAEGAVGGADLSHRWTADRDRERLAAAVRLAVPFGDDVLSDHVAVARLRCSSACPI